MGIVVGDVVRGKLEQQGETCAGDIYSGERSEVQLCRHVLFHGKGVAAEIVLEAVGRPVRAFHGYLVVAVHDFVVSCLAVGAVGEVECTYRAGGQCRINHAAVDGEADCAARAGSARGLVGKCRALLHAANLAVHGLHGAAVHIQRGDGGPVLGNYHLALLCVGRVGGDFKSHGIVEPHLAIVGIVVAHGDDRQRTRRVNNHDGRIDGVASHAAGVVGAVHTDGVCAVRQAQGGRVDGDVVGITVCDLCRADVHPLAVNEDVNDGGNRALVVRELIHLQRLDGVGSEHHTRIGVVEHLHALASHVHGHHVDGA